MIAYDLHIHSCLTARADNDMTPQAIIDKAVENGLDIIALTDHNSMRNVGVASELARDRIAFLPGVEVESSEEVNVVCVFPDMRSAVRMQKIVQANLHDKKNKPAKFGHQYIVDEDGDIDEEDKLLSFPTKMTIEEIFYAARQMGGAAFYATLDQKAYSVVSVLGTIPKRPEPKAIEYTNSEAGKRFLEKKGKAIDKPVFFNSNAHRLADINTRENSADLEELGADIRDEAGNVTAEAFIDWLRAQPGI
ncbi:MAG: PHP domain-containing protein [Bacillota bacterium]|nr:PHP domain-containing protein [Bacillota bacterium]